MNSLMWRQYRRVGFAFTLLVLAGLGKLWVEFGTIWAPVMVLLGLGGVVAVVLALMLRAARRWKSREYNKGLAEALGPYAGDYEETRAYARSNDTTEEHKIDLGDPYHDPREPDGVSTEVWAFVSGLDFIPFLEVNRDPMLWAHVAVMTNLDYRSEYKVLEWMVRQPDCEAALARDIWAHLEPDDLVAAVVGDEAAEESWRLPVLQVIAERGAAGDYLTGRLRTGFHDHSSLAERAQAAAARRPAGGAPLVDVPVRLLTMPLAGPALDRRAYYVDEEGLHGRPGDFARPVGADQ